MTIQYPELSGLDNALVEYFPYSYEIPEFAVDLSLNEE